MRRLAVSPTIDYQRLASIYGTGTASQHPYGDCHAVKKVQHPHVLPLPIEEDPVLGSPDYADKTEKDWNRQERQEAKPCQKTTYQEGDNGRVDNGQPEDQHREGRALPEPYRKGSFAHALICLHIGKTLVVKDRGDHQADGYRYQKGLPAWVISDDPVRSHHHDGSHVNRNKQLAKTMVAISDWRCNKEEAAKEREDNHRSKPVEPETKQDIERDEKTYEIEEDDRSSELSRRNLTCWMTLDPPMASQELVP